MKETVAGLLFAEQNRRAVRRVALRATSKTRRRAAMPADIFELKAERLRARERPGVRGRRTPTSRRWSRAG